MNKSPIIRTFVLAALLAAGGQAVAGDATRADAEAAIAAAEAARTASAELKYEWTTTGELIAEARAALEAGKFGDAVALAGKAEFQGKASVAQAQREQEAWKASVIR